MSHRKTVEAAIKRIYQSYPAEFYLSQWQKDGKCAAEFFDQDIYTLAGRIRKKLTEAEEDAFLVCVPRTKEFERMKRVLFDSRKDFDLTKASLLHHLYEYVKRQSLKG